MQFWYVYVLRSARDHQFYIGSTNDLKRRVQQHQRGENISTANRLPLELIYFEGHRSKDDTLRREKYFKTTKGKVTLKQMLRDTLKQPTWARDRAAVVPLLPADIKNRPQRSVPVREREEAQEVLRVMRC